MAFRTITAREAADRLATSPSDVVLLDCRQPEEWAIAKVAGSLDIPMREIPGRLPEIDRSRDVLVICHSGVRSLQVAMFLARQGFPRVASVEGGIDAWSATVDPSIPTY
jgi:rhodanese-related sulfurtransferase